MEQSILKSTKKTLGLDPTYTPFDLDVITYINGAFSTLNQIGIGPDGGFSIEDDEVEWDDYDCLPLQLHMVKIYVSLRAKILFDPPATSYLIDASNAQLKEYEWRLSSSHDQKVLDDIAAEEASP